MEEVKGKLIGKITHYFDHLGVAVLQLTAKIKAGDTLRIVGGDVDFEQTVESMQVEHKEVKSAKKGDEVGMKVSSKVRDGYRIYKV
jgi:U32 family peptidase